MIDCMIIGDSIATGVAMVRTECVSYARGGWNSWQWNKDYLSNVQQRPSDTLIISLGANDHKGIKTEAELRKMRSTVSAKRVFWIGIGPDRKPDVQAAIEKVAADFGDTVIKRPDRQLISSDGIHPTPAGYRKIAEQTK